MVMPHDSKMDDPSNNPPCLEVLQEIGKEALRLAEGHGRSTSLSQKKTLAASFDVMVVTV